jgi:hypothetical protein
MIRIKDFPKIESVFEREMVNGNYVCIPKIKEEYKWVFTDKCIAVDKLHGTNTSVIVEEEKIRKVLNRTNIIDIWKGKGANKFYIGIKWAIDNNIFNPEIISDGQVFGELCGGKLSDNNYTFEGYRWIPFEYLKEKYYFKFWDDIIKECEGKTDEQIFKIVEEVFKGLWSIYKRQLGIKGEVNENIGNEGLAAEGIVFYNKETGQMCKCRRDMFSFFKGRRHNDFIKEKEDK